MAYNRITADTTLNLIQASFEWMQADRAKGHTGADRVYRGALQEYAKELGKMCLALSTPESDYSLYERARNLLREIRTYLADVPENRKLVWK